jgi:hypothetical protein
MTAVPVEILVTIPSLDPIVATAVLPLVHTPPGTRLLNMAVSPAQMRSLPVMGGMVGFTVTVVVW